MDNSSTLKKISGFWVGLGILSFIVTLLIMIFGVYLMVLDRDSSMMHSIVNDKGMQRLLVAFTKDGYTKAESVNMFGLFIMIVGLLAMLAAVFNTARGIIGFKVANHGTCITAAVVLGILGVFGDCSALILGIINNSAVIAKALYAALSVLYVYFVFGTKRDIEDEQIRKVFYSSNKTTSTTEAEAAEFFK